MSALTKLSLADRVFAVAGVVLLIGMLLFPWFSSHPFGYHYTAPATDGPGSGWGIVALIVLFWVMVDFGLARFSPQTQVPISRFGREITRLLLVIGIAVLLVIRLLWWTDDWGWGRTADLILLAVVVFAALRSNTTAV